MSSLHVGRVGGGPPGHDFVSIPPNVARRTHLKQIPSSYRKRAGTREAPADERELGVPSHFSVANVFSAIDDQVLASDHVVFDEGHHGLRDVVWVRDGAKRCGGGERRLLRVGGFFAETTGEPSRGHEGRRPPGAG